MQSQQLSMNQTRNTQMPLTITRVLTTLTDGEVPSCSTSNYQTQKIKQSEN